MSLALSSQLVAADYYPHSSRFGDYQPGIRQGVVGGIPSRSGGNVINVTDYGWSASNTGAQNSSAFNAARDASAAGDIISIPAGTFATAGISLGRAHPNRTVRGAGMSATILQNTAGSSAWGSSGNINYGNPSNARSNITAMTAGSSTITVVNGLMPAEYGDTYNGQPGRIARIYLHNEAATPIVSTSGFGQARNFTVLLQGRSGNNLTLSQPLPSAFADAMAAGTCYIEVAFQLDGWEARGIGLEDLTLDSVNAPGVVFQVSMAGAYNCWLKNVRTLNSSNYAVGLTDAINCEIRHCEINGASGGSNLAGILMNTASYCLVEDNYITGGPAMEINAGSMSNIVAFNYIPAIVNGNHGAHNSFNLYEGNAWYFYQADGYFGSVSDETIFRNWITSGVSASLKRFTRRFNYLGNLVGTLGATYTFGDYSQRWGDPNIGNESSVGTASLLGTGGASPWPDWDVSTGEPRRWTGTLTTRTSNTAGVITLAPGQGTSLATAIATNGSGNSVRNGAGHIFFTITNITGDVVTFNTGSNSTAAQGSAVTIAPGPTGFQQFDLDVAATTIRKENWYVVHGNTIPGGESLGNDTLPASYFRTSKPDWWGDRPWPAFDSRNPGVPAATNIPAGYRFVHGADPVTGPKAAPQFVRISARP